MNIHGYTPKDYYRRIDKLMDTVDRLVLAGNQPDLRYIEKFSEAIESLKDAGFKDRFKMGKLQRKFEAVAERMTEAVAPVFDFDDVVIPRIRPEEDLQNMINEYEDGTVKAGLEWLQKDFNVQRIAGDGHCLFRAMAAEHLRDVASKHDEEIPSMLDRLKSQIEILDRDDLSDDFAAYKLIVYRLIGERENPYDLILDPVASDALVQFFRKLSSTYLAKFGDDTFENVAAFYAGSKEAYLAEMEEMDVEYPMMGGEPEMNALAFLFRAQIHNLNAFAIGNGEAPNAPHSYYGDSRTNSSWNLLFRVNHYDVLRLK